MVAVLLQLQMRRLQDPNEHGVVLILGANEWQRTLLKAELLRICPELRPGLHNQPRGWLLPPSVPSSGSSNTAGPTPSNSRQGTVLALHMQNSAMAATH